MKDQVSILLGSDKFMDYIKGYLILASNVGTANLPDEELDQDIIERACGILVLEKWAQHEDYIGQLKNIMMLLNGHRALLKDEEIGTDLIGVVMFTSGLRKHKHDVSGFRYPSGSGFLLSTTALQTVQNYLKKIDFDPEEIELFNAVEQWYQSIASAQYALATILVKIKKWNSSMANGFYNILKIASPNDQSRMLAGLHFVLEDLVVKEEILGRYLSTLNKTKETFVEKGQTELIAEVDSLIAMVEKNSKGE